MSWFHGTTSEMAERVAQLGAFPHDYSSKKAVWGPGVYMSDDADEVARWGEVAMEIAPQAKMLDVSAEKWGWGPITVMENIPEPGRDVAQKMYRKRMDNLQYGSNSAGDCLRAGIEAAGYQGLIFTGDNDNKWAVCYEPELVAFQRVIPARPELGGLESASQAQASSDDLSIDR